MNGSCVIMKWHFLEGMLSKTDSTGTETMTDSEDSEGLCLISPDDKGPGGPETLIPRRCPDFSSLWQIAWSDANTVTKLPCPGVSLRTQKQVVSGSQTRPSCLEQGRHPPRPAIHS